MSKEHVGDIPEFSKAQYIFLEEFELIHEIDGERLEIFRELIKRSIGKEYDGVLQEELRGLVAKRIGSEHTQRKLIHQYETYRIVPDSFFFDPESE